jgi:prepilin-type N-terminal cleavage/methylation domain-containing protein
MRKLVKAIGKIYSGRVGEGGFTLIELLVVIGILAAIAGVVTLAVGRFIGAGTCQACTVDRHNVQTAVVAYQADPINNGAIPQSMADIGGGKYLLDNPKYPWTWNTSTGVINESCHTMVASCPT